MALLWHGTLRIALRRWARSYSTHLTELSADRVSALVRHGIVTEEQLKNHTPRKDAIFLTSYEGTQERIVSRSLDAEGFEPTAAETVKRVAREVENIMLREHDVAAQARDRRWQELNDGWLPGEKAQRDDISRVILIRREVRPDETPEEREHREFYMEAQQFFHTFWDRHNRRYEKQRKLFASEVTKHAPQGMRSAPAPEHWSSFYKHIAEDAHGDFERFNKEWYARLRKLMWLELRAAVSRIRQDVMGRKSDHN